MDWSKLYFGKVTKEEVAQAIHNRYWQVLRRELKGRSLEEKYEMLMDYYRKERVIAQQTDDKESLRLLQVRVTNYVTALSRGGLIKVGDYRKND